MSLSDAYATAEQYRDTKGGIAGDNDAVILRDLKAISRYIDARLGYPLGFNKDTAEDGVVRVYEMETGGGRYPNLIGHTYVSVASVEIGDKYTGVYGSPLAVTAYWLKPRTAASLPVPKPYREIELLSPASSVALVRVTGIGGWASVPDAIVSATIELTAIFRIESSRATSKISEPGVVFGTSRKAQDIVESLYGSYLNPAKVLV